MAKVATTALLESLKSKDPKVYDIFRDLDSRLSSVEGAEPDDILNVLNKVLTPRTYKPVVTASVTNPTMGNSTLTGAFIRIGPIVLFRFTYTYGNAGVAAGNGTYYFTLPYEAMDTDWACSALLFINGTKTYSATATPQDTTKVLIVADELSTILTHNTPAAWTAGSSLKVWGFYFVKSQKS